jgi:DNA processing protein
VNDETTIRSDRSTGDGVTTMFGIDDSALLPLLRRLVGELPRAQLEDRFARASWTGIAEPGDRIAGMLVAALGASTALSVVVEQYSVARIAARLAEVGEIPTTSDDLGSALERWQPRVKSSVAVTALRQAARYSVRLRVPGDDGWPTGFADLGEHAPIALWVRGNDAALVSLERSIALVGARAATGYGEHVTMEASAGLVDRGFSIVSGAAYGIDGMAHRAALASSGQTIAFLAGGVDRFYPSGHDALLTRIAESGVVLSELPCGSPPTKWRFLQRNRLIAAASLATVVLEAGWRSGSLNTAGHASSLGRPLGAMPGPVTSAASAGCHRLIRDFTAVLVTNAEEMAELVPFPAGGLQSPDHAGTGGGGSSRGSSDQTRVLDALSRRSARTASEIAERAGLSISSVQSILGVLELESSVAERERGWVRKAG